MANYSNSSAIRYPNTKASISFMNADSKLQKSKLSVEYWAGGIRLSISPMIENGNKGQFPQFDSKASVSAYFLHSKAYILMQEITKLLKDPNCCRNTGIRSGDNMVLISSPNEFSEANNYVLSIYKMVPKTNEIKECMHYEFKANYHCAIRNFDLTTSKFDTAYDYDTLELKELGLVLKSYVDSGSSAYSADLIYKETYDRNRYFDRLNAIAKNLGVEIKSSSYSNNSYSGGSSYNGGSNNNSYSKPSYPQYKPNNGRYVMDDDDIPF